MTPRARIKKQKGHPNFQAGEVYRMDHGRHGVLKVEIVDPSRHGHGWPLVKVLEHLEVDRIDVQNGKVPSVGSSVPIAAIMCLWERVE